VLTVPPSVKLWYPLEEHVFQPKYATYLNLIEPWWKVVLLSLVLKDRRFEAWDLIAVAVEQASVYLNAHSSKAEGAATSRAELPKSPHAERSLTWRMRHLIPGENLSPSSERQVSHRAGQPRAIPSA
jgi:hypothetical protein